jgi:endonuclease/exonuclease/phosphatase (EEP) superfamily protein YafD
MPAGTRKRFRLNVAPLSEGHHDDREPVARPTLRRARSVAGLTVRCLGWAIVAVLGSVVVARAVAWDRWRWFADLDAAIEVLFLPAWLVLLGALLGRRWWMVGAAACICAAQVVYVAPEILASTPVPAAAAHEPTVRLFDANVYQNNHSMAGYVRQLRSFRPDILTMEESLPGDWGQLDRAGVLATLPHQFKIQSSTSRGFIVASRYPLGRITVSYVDGLAYLIRTTVALPGRTVDLWVVHTTAPVNPDWNQWNLELDGVYEQLVRYHPRPLLMVGDFNASWGNRGFRAILSTGLTDAAAARGQPFAFTWSQLLPVLPPLVRIDHVITGGDLTVTTIGTHSGPGSEHRDLTATVAFIK